MRTARAQVCGYHEHRHHGSGGLDYGRCTIYVVLLFIFIFYIIVITIIVIVIIVVIIIVITTVIIICYYYCERFPLSALTAGP